MGQRSIQLWYMLLMVSIGMYCQSSIIDNEPIVRDTNDGTRPIESNSKRKVNDR